MKILPVIVLYNQNLYASRTFLSLLKGTNIPFVIYDNSPIAIHKVGDFGNEILYKHDKENGGVSRAYNYGASYAKEHGFDWLLLLDQDTLFPEGALMKYDAALQQNPRIMLFSPVIRHSDSRPFSPTRSFLRHAYPVEKKPGRIYSLSKVIPVNSGILVNTEAFLQVDGYDEKLPLDFADFQFIDRFASKYDQFFLIDLICIQDFSNEEQDPDQLVKRFEIFCKSAKHCRKGKIYDSFCFLYIVFRRAVGLTLRTKKLVFLKKVFSDYLS